MAELPFCPRAKYSSASRTSVRCRCRTSSAIFSHKRRCQRQRGDQRGVPVALDHLRCHRRGLQTQPRADALLGFRTDMREGSHRARDLAHAQVFGGRSQAHQIAPRFAVPDGQLQSEGDRLGVYAVGAADLHGVFEFESAALQDRLQSLQAGQQNPASLPDLQAPARYPPRRWKSARNAASATLRRDRRPACSRPPRW